MPTACNFSYYDYELQKESNRAAVGLGMSLIYKNKRNKFSFGGGGFLSGEGYIGENLSDTGTGKKFPGEYADAFTNEVFSKDLV